MIEKYVVTNKGGVEQIFTFPKEVDHDRMFEAIGYIRTGSEQNWDRGYRLVKAVSAGFISNGRCYGESETLRLSSRHEVDTALLSTTRNTSHPPLEAAQPAPREDVIDALGCDQVAELCLALSWLGESTYESQEECAARQRHLIIRLIRAVSEHRALFQSPRAEESHLREPAAALLLKSIIEDGYLSETKVGRYHRSIAVQGADAQRDHETLLGLMRVLIEGETGQNVLWKLSQGQSTETPEGKAWLAAKALVDLMSNSPPSGATQLVWIVNDDLGEHVMLCPNEPHADALGALTAQIERNVSVEQFVLFPVRTRA